MTLQLALGTGKSNTVRAGPSDAGPGDTGPPVPGLVGSASGPAEAFKSKG